MKPRTEESTVMLIGKSMKWNAQNINNEYWRFHAHQGPHNSQVDDEFLRRYSIGTTEGEKELVRHSPVCATGKFKTKSFEAEQYRLNTMTGGKRLHIDMLETKVKVFKHYVALTTDEVTKRVFSR